MRAQLGPCPLQGTLGAAPQRAHSCCPPSGKSTRPSLLPLTSSGKHMPTRPLSSKPFLWQLGKSWLEEHSLFPMNSFESANGSCSYEYPLMHVTCMPSQRHLPSNLHPCHHDCAWSALFSLLLELLGIVSAVFAVWLLVQHLFLPVAQHQDCCFAPLIAGLFERMVSCCQG